MISTNHISRACTRVRCCLYFYLKPALHSLLCQELSFCNLPHALFISLTCSPTHASMSRCLYNSTVASFLSQVNNIGWGLHLQRHPPLLSDSARSSWPIVIACQGKEGKGVDESGRKLLQEEHQKTWQSQTIRSYLLSTIGECNHYWSLIGEMQWETKQMTHSHSTNLVAS